MQRVNKERLSIIYKRDLNEYKSWKVYKVLMFIFTFLPIFMVVRSIISYTNKDNFILGVTNSLFLVALIPPIIDILVFTTVTVVRDKANKLIASLLATPLTISEFLLGKTKAICFLGMIASILGSLFFIITINVLAFLLKGHFVSFTIQTLISIFIISPIFSYELSKMTIQLVLVKSPELAVSPTYLISLIVLVGIPLLSSMQYIDCTSWSFVLEYLAIVLILLLITEVMALKLTKEKVIKLN